MKEIVAASDLKPGMFVAELDRPWLDSPFLIQGFVLEDAQTVQQVQSLCRFVYVDWQRSSEEHQRVEKREPVASTVGASLAGSVRVARKQAQSPPRRDFVEVMRWLRSGGDTPAPDMRSATESQPRHHPDDVRVHRDSDARERAASPLAGGTSVGSSILTSGWRGLFGRLFAERGEAPRPSRRRKTSADAAEKSAGHDAAGAGSSATVWIEEVAVEDELVSAAPVYVEVLSSVEQLINDVQNNLRPDMERVRSGVDDMMHSVVRNPDALLWLTRLKRTDQYAYDHALDVSVLLMTFARTLGLEAAEMSRLGTVGLMQDIGRVRLPAGLLQKTGAITPQEREIFRSHVTHSVDILKAADETDSELLEIVSRHHERFDGSGYPRQLEGDSIGTQAQMAGIVDTYCAMTRQRPWGEAYSSQQALEEVNKMRGAWFGESIVDAFIQCVGLYPVGTLVELHSGEVAVVIGQNRVRRLKPRVLVLLAADKTPNKYPPTLDLVYDPTAPDGTMYSIKKALPAGAFDIDPQEFYLS